ncbi:MAG: branched-subunit amino acid aminotransferase/4-amino-4-deoxychorismate lyase, partial [Alphaproteobacteria bacterium]
MQFFLYNYKFYHHNEMRISPFDRGFTLGDGVFETLKITSAMPELWEHHIRRLTQGCKIMHLACPQDLYEQALSLIKKNNIQSAVLKIIISRQSLHRGLLINTHAEANMTMTLAPLPKPPLLIK